MDRFQNTRQPDWDWWGRLWPTPGATLRRLGVAPGATVVEIGCGNGYFTLPAARITDPAPVYALDLDESLLAELEGLADAQGIENVDTVLVANTFHGIDETDTFVSQVSDSLRSGGRFVVVNWVDRPSAETPVAGEPRGPPTDLRMSPDRTAAVVTDALGDGAVDSVGHDGRRPVG